MCCRAIDTGTDLTLTTSLRYYIEDIRQATQKGWVLGNDQSKDEIEQLVQRRTRPPPRGGDRRSVALQKQRD